MPRELRERGRGRGRWEQWKPKGGSQTNKDKRKLAGSAAKVSSLMSFTATSRVRETGRVTEGTLCRCVCVCVCVVAVAVAVAALGLSTQQFTTQKANGAR